ncbi:F-box domain-containing protein [Caenorhabditis elegans]|uniref:F-box domain-containing protein n=1 Tax=Caenorhabditis elegans TaxID=6239 RepID=Q2YS44_CAEEL|nr:F-box domain-containing protein [Caenorhabditis elegans]CAJ43446.1 F-box domain-containing protein [Caenorhabditis elegans]|eukprot:NP_001041185.1 F-box A protein [Caenorhabditis elegans]
MEANQINEKMAKKLTDELKAIEISGPPSLFDMPMCVMHTIVDNLDAIDRLILRYVNRKLRNFVDNKKPIFKNVKVYSVVGGYNLVLGHDKSTIFYDSKGSGCIARCDGRRMRKINKSSLAALFGDLEVWMKNPQLQLDKFSLYAVCDDELTTNLLKKITNVEYMFHAKSIYLSVAKFSNVISILSHFKPGFLEEIVFFCHSGHESIHELFLLEQWKQVKSVFIKWFPFDDFPFEHLVHVSCFELNLPRISVSVAIIIRDVLMKTAQFEYGKIRLYDLNNMDDPPDIEADVVRVFNPNFVDEYVTRPLQFKVEQFLVTIHKRSLRIKKIENPR